MKRRDFLKLSLGGAAAFALSNGVYAFLAPERGLAAARATRWVFLVDTYRCIGCGFCVKACKTENDVPYDANVSRTWVERYVITRDRRVFADTPKEGREGYKTTRVDLGRGRFQDIKKEEIEKAFFVPKLCNQCEQPPCVQVCPVGATYQTAEGVTLVDRQWCIGCGYCIEACPYGVRFFHPVYRVVDKCNFCYHRLAKGLKPACVQACPQGARKIGNIRDPRDPVAKIILSQRVEVLKSEFGTKPQDYYIGLSEEVR